MWVFETTDYSDIPVVLSEETWRIKAGNHIQGVHPEIQAYLDDIQRTIEIPDIVLQSPRDDRSRIFYQLGVGRDKFVGKHLVVVVKYVQETRGIRGYVSTIYLSRSVYSKGDLIWRKIENTNLLE